MIRVCIAIVDASRARLFTFERSAEADGIHEQLVEHRELVDPARRQRPSELFSDSRPGSGRTGALQYAFDDHRDAAIERMDTMFARTTLAKLLELVRSSAARRLIICASPRMLGELRDASGELRNTGLVIDEMPRDLSKLTAPQIRDRLASYGLLPPQLPHPGLGQQA
jgi:protein required for attachment to host cells